MHRFSHQHAPRGVLLSVAQLNRPVVLLLDYTGRCMDYRKMDYSQRHALALSRSIILLRQAFCSGCGEAIKSSLPLCFDVLPYYNENGSF
jgi:hypothetical protein